MKKTYTHADLEALDIMALLGDIDKLDVIMGALKGSELNTVTELDNGDLQIDYVEWIDVMNGYLKKTTVYYNADDKYLYPDANWRELGYIFHGSYEKYFEPDILDDVDDNYLITIFEPVKQNGGNE